MPHPFYSLFPPRSSRTHEVSGAGRWLFAIITAGYQNKPIIWIDTQSNQQLDYHGIHPFISRHQLHFISTTDTKSQLWCMEEALRSPAVAAVIYETETGIGFTAMRRLQLAAERGNTLGLLLTPQHVLNPATETRWHCNPYWDENDNALRLRPQHWKLVKNKQGSLGEWKVNWDAKTHCLTVL